jgi:hypothetical protein
VNHFPAALADFQLNALTYAVSGLVDDLVIEDGAGILSVPLPVDSSTSLAIAPFDVTYGFPAGETGEFDQDAVEASLAGVVTAILSMGASILGTTLADIQATYPAVIERNWTFTSASQPSASYLWQDTLPYPPEG